MVAGASTVTLPVPGRPAAPPGPGRLTQLGARPRPASLVPPGPGVRGRAVPARVSAAAGGLGARWRRKTLASLTRRP